MNNKFRMNYRYGLRQSGVGIENIGCITESFNMPKPANQGGIKNNKVKKIVSGFLKDEIIDSLDKYMHEHPMHRKQPIICFFAYCDTPSAPEGREYTYKQSIKIQKLTESTCSVIIRLHFLSCSPLYSRDGYGVLNNYKFNHNAAETAYIMVEDTFTALLKFTEGAEKYIYDRLGVKTNIKYEQVYAPSGIFGYTVANNREDTLYYNVSTSDDELNRMLLNNDTVVSKLNSEKFGTFRIKNYYEQIEPTNVLVIKSEDDAIALTEITNRHAINVSKCEFGMLISETDDTTAHKIIGILQSVYTPLRIKYLDMTSNLTYKTHDAEWFDDICSVKPGVIWLWGGTMQEDDSIHPWYEDLTGGILTKEYFERTCGEHPENYMFEVYRYSDRTITVVKINKDGLKKKLLGQGQSGAVDEAFKMPARIVDRGQWGSAGII